jgi:hypothetical protein
MSTIALWQPVVRVVVAAAILIAFALRGFAQTPDADIVRTLHDAPAREAPAADAAVAFTAPAQTDLVWVARGKRNGFYRVIRKDQGPQAWISSADASLAHTASDPPPVKACAASLDQCPARGCEEEGTQAAQSNELKRRLPHLGTPLTLSFADLAQLQHQADESVGQGPYEPSLEQRARLHDLHVSSGTVGEGDLVRVLGFIANSSDGLHLNKSGESVNCQLKKPSENDIHIPLVAAPEDTEFKGIVAEMVPQDRPQAWSVEALKDVRAKRLQVWVEGGLSYDKVHFVDADADNPMKDEPERMSLWEIHPITKFLVCRKPHCDPQFEQDWTPLEAK